MTMLALVLGGCVSLPESGRVQSGQGQNPAEPSTVGFDFHPPGPSPGATPVDVVDGFLLAMQASPVSTAVAREFLTDEGSTGWTPEKSTLVYGGQGPLTESGDAVDIALEETVELDGRGKWLGDTSGGRGVTYHLEMVREKGEWRINNPPDALVIPEAHFESRFEQFFLYYFDQTAQILVPEPVYVPRGDQAPTLLVRRLLRGPDESLVRVMRTFIPRRTELELSVPVSHDGTADLPLSAELLDLNQDDLQMALAQLGWTLRQVPGIDTMRVTVDGSPIDIPGEGSEQNVQSWTQYDPSIHWASQELFGLRDGRVVVHNGEGEMPIEGAFGQEPAGLRSISVDLPAEQIAGVTTDGSSVLVAPRGTGGGSEGSDVSVVYDGGTDLLRPAWDIYGHIWAVDRTRRDGAEITVVRSGEPTTPAAPGINGEDVKAFAVSRDGTRVVAVVEGRSADRLVIARVVRSREGRVLRLTRATELPVGAIEVDEIRDIAWRSPGSVALLTGPTSGPSQVIVALIDGSSILEDLDTNAQVFRQRAVRIVTSPASEAPLYVGTANGQLFELSADGQWTGTMIKGGLLSPTFVG